MKIMPHQLAIALYESTAGLKEAEVKNAVNRFINLLAKEHKLKWRDKIIRCLEEYDCQKEGIKEITIWSARPLHRHLVESLKQKFGNKHNIVKEQVDENLLGGLTVKEGDRVWNFSVKRQLSTLKQHLTSA